MRAMLCAQRAPVEQRPLQPAELPEPTPPEGEVLLDVEVCGVCRTDLHIVENDLPVHKDPVVPGHQVIGTRRDTGQRVGLPWLHESCGTCRFCGRGDENLCDTPAFTGYDVDGGYAEVVSADPDFIYEIPDGLSSAEAAPLMCAGIIGYRAFKRSGARKGSRLGLYGFGASAHIVIQMAKHFGCEVFVMTRGGLHADLAREMGADWVGEATEPPPSRLNAAIMFAPAGELVPLALQALDKGGTLACSGIHMSNIPSLDYVRHLFEERTLTSVTANTRADGRELFQLALEIPIRTHVEEFRLEQANEALIKFKSDQIRGAAVLRVR